MQQEEPKWKLWGLVSVIVADLVGYSLGGLALGYLGWKYVNLPSWTVLVTAMAGLILAMRQIYRIYKRFL